MIKLEWEQVLNFSFYLNTAHQLGDPDDPARVTKSVNLSTTPSPASFPQQPLPPSSHRSLIPASLTSLLLGSLPSHSPPRPLTMPEQLTVVNIEDGFGYGLVGYWSPFFQIFVYTDLKWDSLLLFAANTEEVHAGHWTDVWTHVFSVWSDQEEQELGKGSLSDEVFTSLPILPRKIRYYYHGTLNNNNNNNSSSSSSNDDNDNYNDNNKKKFSRIFKRPMVKASLLVFNLPSPSSLDVPNGTCFDKLMT